MWGIALALFLTLPGIVPGLFAPADKTWIGFSTGGIDYPTYLAKMQWGYWGHWTYPDRLTSEKTEAVPIYTFYLFLGHVARWTGLEIPWVYHLTRIVLALIGFLLFVTWLQKKQWGLWELLAATFAAAAEVKIGGSSPFPLRIQESLWLATLTFPHYMLNFIGLMLVFLGYEALLKDRTLKAVGLGLGGVICLLLGHPFLLALALGIPGLETIIWRRKEIKRTFFYLAMLSFAALPWLLLLAKTFWGVDWLVEWRRQAVLPTPTLLGFLGAQGLATPLAIAGIGRALRAENSRFALVWFVWAWALVYSHLLGNAREFAFAISIPTGIMAMEGMRQLFPSIKSAKAVGAFIVIVGSMVMMTLYWAEVLMPEKAPGIKYLPQNYMAGIEYLKQHGTQEDVILSRVTQGNLMPYLTGLKPYLGHISETLHYKEKLANAKRFFAGEMSDEEAERFLKEARIKWIVVDNMINWTKDRDMDLSSIKELPYESVRKVFANDHIIIWKVENR